MVSQQARAYQLLIFWRGADPGNCSYNNLFSLGWWRVLSGSCSWTLDRVKPVDVMFLARKSPGKTPLKSTKFIQMTTAESVGSVWKLVVGLKLTFLQERRITKRMWGWSSLPFWDNMNFIRSETGAIIGDGRRSKNLRAAMIWDNFPILRTNCAILTSYIHVDPRICR